MVADRNHKIHIVTMDVHFLYLPLYYADSKKFFGFVPDNYDIEIMPSTEHTDDSAFEMLMDTTSRSNEHVEFAVADPTTVLKYSSLHGPAPAVLAALISNTAFWAVNHHSHNIVIPTDLTSFDEIIAFKPGTTSYSIAQKIFKDANKPNAIRSVNPRQELVLLRTKTNTVALSPDILGIDQLLYNYNECSIDLTLSTTQEFGNIFMTALLSRRDVVESHQDLVLGLLQALQLAMFLVKADIPDIIEYASSRFREPKERITSALRRAGLSQVFPMTIEVSEVAWMNAARIFFEANGASSFGAGQQTEARRIFQHAVQPYLHLARKAVVEVAPQGRLIPNPEETSWRHQVQSFVENLLWIGVGTGVYTWGRWLALVVSVMCIFVAKILVWKLQLKPFSFTWWRHWFSCMSFQAVIFAWIAPDIRSEVGQIIPLTVAVTLLLAEVQLVDTELRRLK